MTEQHITMTRKEYEVVKLLGRGLLLKEAAKELGISSASVVGRLQTCRRRFLCKTNGQLFYRLAIATRRTLPGRCLGRAGEQAHDGTPALVPRLQRLL